MGAQLHHHGGVEGSSFGGSQVAVLEVGTREGGEEGDGIR